MQLNPCPLIKKTMAARQATAIPTKRLCLNQKGGETEEEENNSMAKHLTITCSLFLSAPLSFSAKSTRNCRPLIS